MGRSLLVCLVALAASGCTPDLCARSSDCASGQVCSVAGLCAIPADASTDAHDASSTVSGDAPTTFNDADTHPAPDSVLPEVADDPRRR